MCQMKSKNEILLTITVNDSKSLRKELELGKEEMSA